MSVEEDLGPYPPSPWSELAPSPPGTGVMDGLETADVAVIGAGFTGLSAALHLAERGVSVVVLEAKTIGYGASGRNGGQVIPGLKHDPSEIVAKWGGERGEAIARFVGEAPDRVFEIINRHRIDCGASRGGWLQGVHHRSALRAIERRAADWQSRGIDARILDAAETERLTGSPTYVAGYLDPRGGLVNPLALARGLAAASIHHGARIFENTPALDLSRDGSNVSGPEKAWTVSTLRGNVRADRVLLATNAYTAPLWPSLGKAIIPVHSYQVATAPLSDNLKRTLLPNALGLSETRRLLYYARQDAAGRLLVGGRGRFTERPSSADYANLLTGLRKLFPALGEAPELTYRWVGRLALTRDHLPHIGEIAPGLTAAIAFNGRGVAMTTGLGPALADHLCGRPLDALPLPVRPIRPLPFSALKRQMLAVALAWNRFKDWRETG